MKFISDTGIVLVEICVFDKQEEALTGKAQNEYRQTYIDLGSIVSLRDFESDDNINGFPLISCRDGGTFVLKELKEDILEAWVRYKTNTEHRWQEKK